MDKPIIFDGIKKKDLEDTKLAAMYANLCKNEIHYWYHRGEANFKQSICLLLLERVSGGREGLIRRIFHYVDSLRCEEETERLFAGKPIAILDGFAVEGLRRHAILAKELEKRQRKRSENDRKWVLTNFIRQPVKHREKASA